MAKMLDVYTMKGSRVMARMAGHRVHREHDVGRLDDDQDRNESGPHQFPFRRTKTSAGRTWFRSA